MIIYNNAADMDQFILYKNNYFNTILSLNKDDEDFTLMDYIDEECDSLCEKEVFIPIISGSSMEYEIEPETLIKYIDTNLFCKIIYLAYKNGDLYYQHKDSYKGTHASYYNNYQPTYSRNTFII
jgi:hypothetical protein